MKRRVLVVSPRMPPYNGADAHRARVMLPHLARLGWEATLVAASEASAAGTIDRELLETLPPDVETIRLDAWPALGPLFRQHALRAYLPWRRALAALISERRPDVVFVSTTDFPLWRLSIPWNVPVVLDWQDPWVSDYYDSPRAPAPPGGRLRYGLMQALARASEPAVARHAAAHVVVSPAYAESLRRRYPDLRDARFLELPMAAARSDLERSRLGPAANLPPGKRRWWVHAGRGGPDLEMAIDALFVALAAARRREPGRFEDLGLLFQGTAYDPRETRQAIAERAKVHGLEDMVVERTERLGLLETYRLLESAEALLAPGSDDPAYTASKLPVYLLTGQPLLAVFHAQSPARRFASAHPAVRWVEFDRTDAAGRASLASAIEAAWLRDPLPPRAAQVELGIAEAGAMSEALCALFDAVALGPRRP